MVNVFKNLDWSVLTNSILSVIPALICITLHELAHGYVAYRLGDNTAKNMGRLTLNPLKHIDIMGFIMMAVFHFGWAKPVPIDMRNFKNPKRGMAITALAGPVSNFLIAVVFLALYGLFFPLLHNGGFGDTLLDMFSTTVWISISLGIFNIIPIPPLDGSKVLFSCISDSMYYKLMHYERYGMLLIAVLLLSGVLSSPMTTAVNFVYGKLFFIAEGAYKLGLMIF
jgi:Zn-dependent protease